jgi:hypothetical protein
MVHEKQEEEIKDTTRGRLETVWSWHEKIKPSSLLACEAD